MDAALIVPYGLVAFGHIQLRKVDGYQQLPAFIAKEWQNVAYARRVGQPFSRRLRRQGSFHKTRAASPGIRPFVSADVHSHRPMAPAQCLPL